MTAKLKPEEFESRYSPEPNTGCWLWLGPVAPNGYGTHGNERAHRVSYEMHKGPIPKGLWVLHSCDNRLCVSPAHLRVGTRHDNINDMVKRRRNRVSKQRGTQNPAAKLDEAKVGQIRNRLASGERHGAIARDFSLSRTAVWAIANERTWSRSQQ